MFASFRQKINALRSSTSGNATMLVALGLPMLMGGTGLAVDTAQWFMWKRELQFAVDQAALAGAWARTQTDTKPLFSERAQQEYQANLSATKPFASGLTVNLANYSGGSDNSVTVSAQATKPLPFSSFLTGNATTVTVYAQAAYTEGQSFTSCMIAVDADDSGAITIGGSSVMTAGCGIAALSNSASSIVVSGDPQINAGWVLSRGGIDDWFSTHTEDEIHEYMEGLQDPFASLSPPNPSESQVARTYSCVKGNTVTKTTPSGTKSITTPDLATVFPGTYTDIKVACATTFSTGVYIIDGGGLEIDGQYEVTGSGVMFVLKNGAYVKINGGSNVNLTAMQASDLIARGVSQADANKLAGMLIFEARDSGGSTKNRINGTSNTVLNGTIYLPKSGIEFSGTASVSSQCLMIAAANITLSGTANMTTFCPTGLQHDDVVTTEISKVKLVV